jgi:hypothetical protein
MSAGSWAIKQAADMSIAKPQDELAHLDFFGLR